MESYCVELRTITKRYGDTVAVDRVSLKVKTGSFVTLLGPSGCGKTTTLRMIGGFEEPSSGEIFLMGRKILDSTCSRQETNMVFQDYALFPHKTVGQNIGFGLKMRGVKKAERQRKVLEMLELINLTEVYDRLPNQLSGGQRQRVALARALILKPPILLLDEPLGALDAKIRKQLQLELKHVQEELGITFIYVTHDQEEAMTMSDVIAIMNQGKIEQIGSPRDIYETPRTLFVAGFVGECNVIPGEVGERDSGSVTLRDSASRMFRSTAGAPDREQPEASRGSLVVRPEDIHVGAVGGSFPNRVGGMVVEKLYTGGAVRLIVDAEGLRMVVDADKGTDVAPGDTVELGWDSSVGTIIWEA